MSDFLFGLLPSMLVHDDDGAVGLPRVPTDGRTGGSILFFNPHTQHVLHPFPLFRPQPPAIVPHVASNKETMKGLLPLYRADLGAVEAYMKQPPQPEPGKRTKHKRRWDDTSLGGGGDDHNLIDS